MDRLICGDVGYGKTEVALRAAFKAAADGRQVLMLVPTTILAQQHAGTFAERLQGLPVHDRAGQPLPPRRRAEARRSQASPRARWTSSSARTACSSRDVRAKDLGLLIVDEEQRFGVKQKELLRQLKLKVDVISMSATPIPRTLQMSLAGVRDISVIETPPEGRRPVKTYVGEYDEDLVRQALKREGDRKGQAFFLHNRVETIDETAERLRGAVPRPEASRSRTGRWTRASSRRGCSRSCAATPTSSCARASSSRASTSRRPTRSSSIAPTPSASPSSTRSAGASAAAASAPTRTCCIPARPRSRRRPGSASRRSRTTPSSARASRSRCATSSCAARATCSATSSPGHVAALGFELYMQMLDEAVQALAAEGEDREEVPEPVRLDVSVDAYVPADYIPYEQAKIDVHRRIAGARDVADLGVLRDELEDRFGPVPEPLSNLISLQQARIKFGQAGVTVVTFRGGRLAATPVELDSTRAKELRSRLPSALYESGRASSPCACPRTRRSASRGGPGGRRAARRRVGWTRRPSRRRANRRPRRARGRRTAARLQREPVSAAPVVPDSRSAPAAACAAALPSPPMPGQSPWSPRWPCPSPCPAAAVRVLGGRLSSLSSAPFRAPPTRAPPPRALRWRRPLATAIRANPEAHLPSPAPCAPFSWSLRRLWGVEGTTSPATRSPLSTARPSPAATSITG